jgi:Tol biopolymer transport system component
MDVNGDNLQRITDAPSEDRYPAWSPDGTQLVFESDRAAPIGQESNRFDLWIVNADGSDDPRRLTSDPLDEVLPEWSPDGERIGYSISQYDGQSLVVSEMYVIDAAGSNPQLLEPTLTADSAPAWSLDGRFITFQSFRDGNWDIYLMRADGSGQTPLTTDASADMNPSWSPSPPQTAAGDMNMRNQDQVRRDDAGSH